METIGKSLIKGISTEKISNELVKLYAFEQVSAYAIKVALSKIGGKAEIMLESRLAGLGDTNEKFSDKIADRINVLGGTIPEDLATIPSLDPVNSKALPSPNDMPGILKALWEKFRAIIPVYHELIETVKDKDPFTYMMLLPILEYYVIHEDELQTGGWF